MFVEGMTGMGKALSIVMGVCEREKTGMEIGKMKTSATTIQYQAAAEVEESGASHYHWRIQLGFHRPICWNL
jgi:hypothetical protein